MFPETGNCLKAATRLVFPTDLWKELRWSASRGRASFRQAQRHFSVGRCLTAKAHLPRQPKEKVEIPGLDVITYGEKMHYVPGLSKPTHPFWERDFKDPRFHKAPPAHEMPLYKEKPCYVFHQRTSALEGLRQALWLTKTKMIPSLPPQLLSLAERAANQMPDQDERVQNAIKHARFWDTTEERPEKRKYCNTLLLNLLHLCGTLQTTNAALRRRDLAERYSLSVSWKRGDDQFQIRGLNGLLHSCMDPLPVISGKQEVNDTAEHVLEDLYPISPTISLHKANVYKADVNCSGFTDDYPYPHAHTLYFLDGVDPCWTLLPEQFRTKMLMFAFGNALVRAHKLYEYQPQGVLERPITVQAVGTNGRRFQLMVFQLNTTDLSGDDGIKNQVWLESDVELYDFAKVRPYIKKKQVKVPAGLAGYKPETFNKFLALYLHGAV